MNFRRKIGAMNERKFKKGDVMLVRAKVGQDGVDNDGDVSLETKSRYNGTSNQRQ